MKQIKLLTAILLFIATSLRAGEPLTLWYDHPATTWTEALPLGNSRLGAMVYGGTAHEEIQLNEETMWGGSPYRNDNPNALKVLPQVRELIFAGKRGEAQHLIESGLVKRNHAQELRGDVHLEEGDLLSIRGYGRMKVLEFEGRTRKGRLAVRIFRYTA